MTIQYHQLKNKTWIWYHQTRAGAFYRAGRTYATKAAARAAATSWTRRRADPRNRGR